MVSVAGGEACDRRRHAFSKQTTRPPFWRSFCAAMVNGGETPIRGAGMLKILSACAFARAISACAEQAVVPASFHDGGRRYHLLDFIRGVAAILVMQRHVAMRRDKHINATFLAVDLFFMLSGFVMAHAYERRLLSGTSVAHFMALRFIRLWPLYLIGMFLGLIDWVYVDIDPSHSATGTHLATIIFLTALMLPSFGLPIPNGPRWSLSYELAANLAHATSIRLLSVEALLGVSFVSAISLFLLLKHGARIDGGWRVGGMEMGVGLCRVGYSYFLGVFLYRARSEQRPLRRLAIWLCGGIGLAAIGAVMLPHRVGAEFAMVLLVFPMVVYLAAGVDVTGKTAEVCAFLGIASYSIYVIHEPLGALIQAGLRSEGIDPWGKPVFGVLFLAFILALSWLLDRYYDAPARRWLKDKMR
jgi:peptidoglycan/LPS O-acetylase OafA/YrhL